LFVPTLDRIFLPTKIKIVGMNKPSSVQKGFRRAKRVRDRPYDMRVRRYHGGGLWTIEHIDGQLYLAVLSRESNEQCTALREARRADGSAYRQT